MSWFSIQELEYLLRIVLAAVCGGAIGFERERRSKSAGIRTHIIVALSAHIGHRPVRRADDGGVQVRLF